ncbi:hypothetical protein C8J27_1027 [Rhodobacter aestuarii]|uniref:DUF6473 domain-containing protein n=1 Tax=Rhodobacter aestuarii TaxID=453582 RepID=A0A1N7N3M5_9RHOB|nr:MULTISPECIES: DUF6473 family protein [Rhodobacter]PTV96213.1 hypothetical protein C8J27_1027 [Rhodobacter aestuarii]SIS92942.1 hypothetical protein SAMN05421580_1077 [Rhodobacter aestuarii]SOB93616.1 hypothetical protein SAMN05877809_101726 [Rhodobacter sp. JA431]
MAFEYAGSGALDYFPCRYGKSKLLFRGPRRDLTKPFVGALGGTETYGKFIADPWPALLEDRLEFPVVNFGYLNAGIDVFYSEPQIPEIAKSSNLTIIQLLGAPNMSNRFYAVHPRRNDRFLRASNLMRAVFDDVDFTEFNFTRHMLTSLQEFAPDRFDTLVTELRTAWIARMRGLLEKVTGPKLLLWVADYHAPLESDPLGPEPLLVSKDMVAEIAPLADGLVKVNPSTMARSTGTVGMHFAPLEEPAANTMPGPIVHQEIAEALAPEVRKYI